MEVKSRINSQQIYPKGQADPDSQRPDKWSSSVIDFMCTFHYPHSMLLQN